MFTVIHRQKQRCVLGLILIGLALALPAATSAQDALFTSDVSMDVTGDDANAAREEAMKGAEREGLGQLLEKLAPDQKSAILKELDETKISTMVKGVEVLDEKITGNRYRALFRLSYNAIAVNGLLEKRAGAGVAVEPPPPSTAVLVVPVLESDGKAVLFDAENTWLSAWKSVALELPGGNIVVPYGDEADAKVVSAETIQAANYAALIPLFKRYGVGEVVVLRANAHSGENAGVDVVRRHVSEKRSEVFMADYQPDRQEDRSALLLRAARDVADQVMHQREALIARQAALAAGGDNRLTLIVPFSRLASWTKVRNALLKLPTVTRLDMLAMSSQQVDASVQFRGTEEMLARDLQGLGLRVTQSGGYWIVSEE